MDPKADVDGRKLEQFRAYLHLMARLGVAKRLQSKVDVSGVVQQTLLEAFQAMDKFRPMNDEQQTAWLRRALANNLTDEIRKFGTAGRDAVLERSLEAALEESSARLGTCLATHGRRSSHRCNPISGRHAVSTRW